MAAALVSACGSGTASQGSPEAALSTTRSAQQEFRDLRRRFILASPDARARLAGDFERFLSRHAADPSSRVARLYLAWIYIHAGELDRARKLVADTETGPSGSARDFAQVTEAAIAERSGNPARALSLLEPLSGKIVDADERAMHDELYVRAALRARRYDRVLSGLVDWLAHTAAEDQEAVQNAAQDVVAQIPVVTLERVLAPSPEGQSAGRVAARAWLRRTARARLAQLALERRDSGLARRVLEGRDTARLGESEAQLSKLAASSAVVPRVAGRVLGLALSLGRPEAERRSAQVASGMSRALGLLGAAREDGVRLVVRDDGGDPAAFERTLGELAADGAAILVAGFDDSDAGRAAAYAEQSALPVLVLGRPSAPPRAGSYAFVLGADSDSVAAALEAALRARGSQSRPRIGPGGVPCDTQARAAGESRFPVQKWKAERIDAVLLLGDAACSRDAVSELSSIGLRPALGLGFESAELLVTMPYASPMLAVSSGSFPYREGAAPVTMRRWADASGGFVRWYEALGHDAARLGAAALESFPVERVEDAAAVKKLHQKARARLLSASAELWTTERRGFEGRSAIERKLDVLSKAEQSNKP